jgi:hypothetical protein
LEKMERRSFSSLRSRRNSTLLNLSVSTRAVTADGRKHNHRSDLRNVTLEVPYALALTNVALYSNKSSVHSSSFSVIKSVKIRRN